MRPLLASLLAIALVGTAAAQTKKPSPAAAPPPAAAPTASPAPSATPAAPPAPTPSPTPPPPPGATADVDALRQEYLALRDELFQSRARAATVASAIYSTKVSIKLAYGTGRFYNVTRAVVRLDGASVFDDTEGTIASDDGVRFEGWIAPGRHVLTVRVEATGKDDDRFTSATETSVVVQAVAGKDLVVIAKARDGGDLPYTWKKKERGSYKLGVDIDVKTADRPRPGAKK
jgi:pyruvate/2-oxoglutarate dehydrogenase complex dihydrolipoamide acyltransferase (E2) component